MMMNFYSRNHINKIILCAIIKALIVKQSSRKLRKCENITHLSRDTKLPVHERTVRKIELCSCSLPESICLHKGWLSLVLSLNIMMDVTHAEIALPSHYHSFNECNLCV
jgi:hypothetical protein